MKKVLLFVLLFTVVIGFGIFTAAANNSRKDISMSDKKILIAFYSHSGNTKTVAQKIQKLTGGDLFEITPKTPYSKDYNTTVEKAKVEKQTNFMPELVANGNVKEYDIIFVGTPVWWYTMASPVKTFLSENDFNGKMIVPFCTHGGGGASMTYEDMKKMTQGVEFSEGFTSYGATASENDIKSWIDKIGIK